MIFFKESFEHSTSSSNKILFEVEQSLYPNTSPGPRPLLVAVPFISHVHINSSDRAKRSSNRPVGLRVVASSTLLNKRVSDRSNHVEQVLW